MCSYWEDVRLLGWFSRSQQAVLLVGLAMLLLGLVCYLVFRLPREPVYQGKALSVWLQTYNSASGPGRGSPAWKETDDALRHIGTNAIPLLLRMLRARDSGLKLRLVAWAQKQHFIKILWTRCLGGHSCLGPICAIVAGLRGVHVTLLPDTGPPGGPPCAQEDRSRRGFRHEWKRVRMGNLRPGVAAVFAIAFLRAAGFANITRNTTLAAFCCHRDGCSATYAMI